MSEPKFEATITTGVYVWNNRTYPPSLKLLHEQTFKPGELEKAHTLRGWHPSIGSYETPVHPGYVVPNP